MKVDKITFMQTYPTGSFANQKLGMDIIIESTDEDEITEAYKKARELCEKAFTSMNPQINWSEKEIPALKGYYEISVGEPNERPDQQLQAMKELINSKYQTIKTLENLKPKVDEFNDNDLTLAYMKKHEELYLKSKI